MLNYDLTGSSAVLLWMKSVRVVNLVVSSITHVLGGKFYLKTYGVNLGVSRMYKSCCSLGNGT